MMDWSKLFFWKKNDPNRGTTVGLTPPDPEQNALALWEAREWDAHGEGEDKVILYGDILRRRCKTAIEDRNHTWADQRVLGSDAMTPDEETEATNEAGLLKIWVVGHWPAVRDDILRSLWEGAEGCRLTTSYELTFAQEIPPKVIQKVIVSILQQIRLEDIQADLKGQKKAEDGSEIVSLSFKIA